MSLPPVQINVKRRRQDDPVELLYLEADQHHPKRRFTEYCFQRVNGSGDPPPANTTPARNQAASTNRAPRPPIVRATTPGAEIRDESERRATQKALKNRYLIAQNSPEPSPPPLLVSPQAPGPALSRSGKSSAPLRHFRLCHGSPRPSFSNYSAGVRKRRKVRSGWHPTITERIALSEEASKLCDDILETQPKKKIADKSVEFSAGLGGRKSNTVSSPSRTIGQSIQDHPSTWDYDSDQLAQELAAFAFEISQGHRQGGQPEKAMENSLEEGVNTDLNTHEEFILDTYIRVPVGDENSRERPADKVGLLVIEDGDQGLWQSFAESDSGSDWDEEDPDSNAEDNPANDYPDEELDSQDEYGHAAYEHRIFASDDEEYDLNRSWSDSE